MLEIHVRASFSINWYIYIVSVTVQGAYKHKDLEKVWLNIFLCGKMSARITTQKWEIIKKNKNIS